MSNSDSIKEMVRTKYSEIATQSKKENESSCCGGTCSSPEYTIFSEDYSNLEGYHENANLGLGCGIPTQFAGLRPGLTVLDLGSGAGNDAFVARSIVGERGKVIGVDMTEAMINKARENSEQLGFNNVEFRLGEIEKLPLTSNSVNVVISNCVLNLVPDKKKAFSEIFRVLKSDGYFSISDVVLNGSLPEKFKSVAEFYAGCISGAISKKEYLSIIEDSGFKNIEIKKEKQIKIPLDILQSYLSPDEIEEYNNSDLEILSITVYAEKLEQEDCCSGGTGCC
ncbi:MAG: arsenite methyltransferase [Leptospiraceae bacterium]|nr:arsenite methyltransferase [Leptospiraceae bacterium]